MNTGYSAEFRPSACIGKEDLAAWRRLERDAIEPNPFLGPDFALSGLYGEGIELFLVWYCDLGASPVLVGLCLLERSTAGGSRHMVRLNAFDHCYVGTPLVLPGHVTGVIQAMLAARGCAGKVLLLPQVYADGRIAQEILALGRVGKLMAVFRYPFRRPMLFCREGADDYLRKALGGKGFKELRRQERRLAEAGSLEASTYLVAPDEVESLVEDFLVLEASGWKGEQGSALGSTTAGSAAFRVAMCALGAAHKLLVSELRLKGRRIAISLNIVEGDTAFGFKIGWDAALARHGIGVLNEACSIRALLDGKRLVQCVDSCTSPGSFIAGIWTDSRPCAELLFTRSPILSLVLWAREKLSLLKGLLRRYLGRPLPREGSPSA